MRVDTIDYRGAGNSATKKESQMNAAKDFVNYLVRSGQILQTDVPEDLKKKSEAAAPVATAQEGIQERQLNEQQQKPVFQVIFI